MPQQQTGLDLSDERLIVKTLATGNAEREFAADVRTGLTADSKHLSPKYFYDDLGSRLFDAICCLPEYYLTRAENEIISLTQLKQTGKIQKRGQSFEMPLDDRSRGKITLADMTILFQFVTPPIPQPRPQLPASVRGKLTPS